MKEENQWNRKQQQLDKSSCAGLSVVYFRRRGQDSAHESKFRPIQWNELVLTPQWPDCMLGVCLSIITYLTSDQLLLSWITRTLPRALASRTSSHSYIRTLCTIMAAPAFYRAMNRVRCVATLCCPSVRPSVCNVQVPLLGYFECKKMLKVSTFIYRHLQGNPDQQRFTILFEVAYWPATTELHGHLANGFRSPEPQNWQASPRGASPNLEGMGMGWLFNRNCVIFVKLGKIRPRLLLNTNRKLQTCFHLVLNSDDLGWPWTDIFYSISKYIRFFREPIMKILIIAASRGLLRQHGFLSVSGPRSGYYELIPTVTVKLV